MNIQEATAYIQHIEEKYDLLQYQVDGWAVWPLFRFRIITELLDLPVSKLARQNMWTKLDRIQFLLTDTKKLLHLRRARYTIIGYLTNRSEQVNGLYKDIFFDDLLLNISDYYKIEHTDNKRFMQPKNSVLIQSDITSNLLIILSHILGRVKRPKDSPEIATHLAKIFQDEIHTSRWNKKNILTSISKFYWEKFFFSLLFGRVSPKFLLLVTAYGNYAAVAAAKEKSCTVIEFQHGFLNRYHPGYSWTNYAKKFKPVMPIPDKIFLYGDYWKQELENNNFWTLEELRTVGSLRMEQYRHMQRTSHTKKNLLLVTTQGIDTKRLLSFLVSFLKLANHTDYKMVVKLHPGETNNSAYHAAFAPYKNVTILFSHEIPSTFELLTQAKYHISIYSTVHYEAIALGVPTIILPLNNYENVLHLYKMGYAFLAHTPNQLLDVITSSNYHPVPSEVGDLYFKHNALENMYEEFYE